MFDKWKDDHSLILTMADQFSTLFLNVELGEILCEGEYFLEIFITNHGGHEVFIISF